MSLFDKILTNAGLDWQLLSTPPPAGGSRLRSLLHKYVAIARNRHEVELMGRVFRYDNRFTPALLPGYLHEIQRLGRYVPLSSIRNVVDVGANTGQFAFALKLYRPDAAVWSFEPNPEPFRLLCENAARFDHWHPVSGGIGAHAEVPLYYVRGKSGQGSIYEGNATMNLHGPVTQVTVSIAPLDGPRARKLGIPEAVDLLKIDVEGAELDVLRHVAGVRPRWVVMEISVGREGAQNVSVFVDEMRQRWGREPRAIWSSAAHASHGTQEWLWDLGA